MDGWIAWRKLLFSLFLFLEKTFFQWIAFQTKSNCVKYYHYLKFSNGSAPKKSKHWRKCAPCVTQPVSSRTICSNIMLQCDVPIRNFTPTSHLILSTAIIRLGSCVKKKCLSYVFHYNNNTTNTEILSFLCSSVFCCKHFATLNKYA